MASTQCYMGIAFRKRVNIKGGIRGKFFSIEMGCSLVIRESNCLAQQFCRLAGN